MFGRGAAAGSNELDSRVSLPEIGAAAAAVLHEIVVPSGCVMVVVVAMVYASWERINF